ncbi:BRO family protein [Acinetobacter proteolyticus]|nr:phage antirepressor KilAC domain-containing protein [Acinetobacter proteolyticus]WEI17886.1 BRO family protein [Acinetobacter proteolyticus]
MSMQIATFNFNSNLVRTTIKDGEVRFVLADVCNVLEIGNPSDAARRLDNDEVTLDIIEGSHRPVNLINESGLYSLVLTSRKQEAKQFKKWVTSEVLPSIRKNGGYIAGQESDDPELIIAKALQVAQNVIDRKTQELAQATAKVEVLEPKAQALDVLSQNRNGYLCLTDAAKHLHVRVKDLTNLLANKKIIYRRATSNPIKKGKWAAYERIIQKGWLFHDYVAGEKPDGTDYAPQVLVTPKGMAHIALLVTQTKGILV